MGLVLLAPYRVGRGSWRALCPVPRWWLSGETASQDLVSLWACLRNQRDGSPDPLREGRSRTGGGGCLQYGLRHAGDGRGVVWWGLDQGTFTPQTGGPPHRHPVQPTKPEQTLLGMTGGLQMARMPMGDVNGEWSHRSRLVRPVPRSLPEPFPVSWKPLMILRSTTTEGGRKRAHA